jgi:hypothetical protein
VLSTDFEDPGSRLAERCSRRTDIGQSSFSISGRGGLPPSTDVYLSLPLFYGGSDTASRGTFNVSGDVLAVGYRAPSSLCTGT